MTTRINKIIKKAECIKKYLESNSKESGNIDGLIKSLITYRENVGDIPTEKMFYLVTERYYINNENIPLYNLTKAFEDNNYVSFSLYVTGVKCIEFTSHIRSKVIRHPNRILSIPPEVLEEHIADAVFDVQSFKVDDVLLSTELINAGFRPNKMEIKFVCDFE